MCTRRPRGPTDTVEQFIGFARAVDPGPDRPGISPTRRNGWDQGRYGVSPRIRLGPERYNLGVALLRIAMLLPLTLSYFVLSTAIAGHPSQ